MFFPWFNGFKIHPVILLLISLFSVNSIAHTSIPDYRQMAQLAEYIGVDYPEAINSGQVINDEEYQEMLEFSSILVTQAKASEIGALVSNTQALETAIKEKQAPSVIQQLCNQLRTGLLEQMPQAAIPQQLLPVSETQSLFQQQCSACHGTQGKGNGPASAGLEPPPTDFTDRARAISPTEHAP
ncbi:MAG: c-type cytochrome [Alcanivoracaceae bacterium]|jgi:high-affinity iron transporter|nr:c-type cytochrome [Alcanivoracaceae bacterium]